MTERPHAALRRTVRPSAPGREERLRGGRDWVNPRPCRICGHAGRCNECNGKHATAHSHRTGHPIIEGYDPPEGWGFCYVDDYSFDRDTDTTPQVGTIPRYV